MVYEHIGPQLKKSKFKGIIEFFSVLNILNSKIKFDNKILCNLQQCQIKKLFFLN